MFILSRQSTLTDVNNRNGGGVTVRLEFQMYRGFKQIPLNIENDVGD